MRESVVLGTLLVVLLLQSSALPAQEDSTLQKGNTEWSQDGGNYRKHPYLIYTDDNTRMSILWQNFKTMSCFVEWGESTESPAGDTVSYEYGDDHQHQMVLSGMTPNTKYYYRVIADGDTASGNFYTAKEDSDKVLTFYAYGDTRTYPAVHDLVASQILENISNTPSGQTFIVSNGDLVGRTPEETTTWTPTEGKWDSQFFDPQYNNIMQLSATMPYMACVGNYETDDEGVLFRKYFPYSMFGANRYYYSFDNGPVHFTVIDQFTDYSEGSAQHDWLVNDLESTEKAWKIFLMHKPGWSAGKQNNDADVQNILQPLAVGYGVQLIFTGHNHSYSRAVVNKVVHITTGGGGAPLYKIDLSWPNVVLAEMTHHFCKIEIDGNNLDLSAIRTDGSLIGKFSYSDIENIPEYSLIVETVGSGTVNIIPERETYEKDEMVTLIADPAEEYIFSGWGGHAEGTEMTYFLAMDGNKLVTATFQSTLGGDMAASEGQILKSYPNPFSETTTIEYSLTRPAAVKLSVFNAAGREVAKLVSKTQGPGTYQLAWNGIGLSGNRLGPGIYIIRLELDGRQTTESRIVRCR